MNKDKSDLLDSFKEFYSEYESTNLSKFIEETCFKNHDVYSNFDSWSEVLEISDVHWSDKTEYTKQDIYDSVRHFYKNEKSLKREEFLEKDYYPSSCAVKNKTDKGFGYILGEIVSDDELDENFNRCHDCNGIYKNIAHHWKDSKCSYPSLPSKDKQIFRGLLMGDASIAKKSDESCSLCIDLIRPDFLKYLYNKYPVLFTSLFEQSSPEERVKKNIERGFTTEEHPNNYKRIYKLQSRTIPFFSQMRKRWYGETNIKQFPRNIHFTPELLRMWYVCDGGLKFTSESPYASYASFYTSNEVDSTEMLCEKFSEIGFDAKVFSNDNCASINIGNVDKFLEYIGNPLPGFEYKWENKDYEVYQAKKSEIGTLADD